MREIVHFAHAHALWSSTAFWARTLCTCARALTHLAASTVVAATGGMDPARSMEFVDERVVSSCARVIALHVYALVLRQPRSNTHTRSASSMRGGGAAH